MVEPELLVCIIYCCVITVVTGLLFTSNAITQIFGNFKTQIIAFIMVFILNFMAYFHDPSRFTTEKQCLGGKMNCRDFTLLAGLGTFLMDMLMLYTLTKHPDSKNHNTIMILLPTLFLGIYFIYQMYKSESLHNLEQNQEETDKNESHPKGLLKYKNRVNLYAIIMFINCFIWFQTFVTVPNGESVSLHSIGSLPEGSSRFGTSMFDKLLGYGGILGYLVFDLMALYSQISYDSKVYKTKII